MIEICALQWSRCVTNSERDFKNLGANRVFSLKYEEFVNDPSAITKKIIEFIGEDIPIAELENAVRNVSARSVGKGKNELTENEKKLALDVINRKK